MSYSVQPIIIVYPPSLFNHCSLFLLSRQTRMRVFKFLESVMNQRHLMIIVITSGYSNASTRPHPNTLKLPILLGEDSDMVFGPHKSPFQTAPRSVKPFLLGSRSNRLTMLQSVWQ